MTDLDAARQVLRSTFGYSTFRDGQEDVVARLLEGRSCLAIFPTGGGKSLCYQLPALLLDGLTVVVSPLIALMKDQVDYLAQRGVPAARLDSTLGPEDLRRVFIDLREGRLKLLYIAPERLTSERFVATLAGRRIVLLAIDEAHCISEWGHNFRPEYLRLARLAERLRVGRVLGLTATATPEVAADIAREFRIDADDIVRTPFHRPNLDLHAVSCRARDRPRRLLERLEARIPGPAIVYVTLQRTAEDVASFLAGHGHDAVAYHAGLDDERRHQIQDEFMASASRIVVATIAFGMGIDKADIRTVIHYNLPKGPENYAQEIGRAGRDGLRSQCVLFACEEDVITLENFAYGDTPDAAAIAACLEDLLARGTRFDISTYELSQQHDIRPLVLQTLLTYLELAGVLEPTGPFHAEYQFQFVRPPEEILTRFDRRRADFLRGVFQQARPARVWHTIDTQTASEALNEPRERIVKALGYLEETGDLIVKVTGARIGYRRSNDEPDLTRLLESLADRFLVREAREVARIHRMLDFAHGEGCLTRHILDHFGESLAADCGHCGPCLGERPVPLAPLPRREPDHTERAAVERLWAEGHEALAKPRQLARFLTGLTSPATTRARLTRDSRFGILADVPFARTLSLVEELSRDRPH